MFEAVWTDEALETYRKLESAALRARESRMAAGRSGKSRQEGLFLQVAKCVATLLSNPRHPSLATHKFSSIPNPYDAPGGKKGKVFEAYAQNDTPGAYRVFWCYGPDKRRITILAITPHP